MPPLTFTQAMLLFAIVGVLFVFAWAGNWDAVVTIGAGLVLGLVVSAVLVLRRRRAAVKPKRRQRKRRR